MYDMVIGGFAFDWFFDQFCKEMTREEFYTFYLQRQRAVTVLDLL
ncbi:MAG: hypothetical protein ACUVRN_05965 [Candidatus Caldatribacteriaceae bacterium]